MRYAPIHRTTYLVTVLSDSPYEVDDLSVVANDITQGDFLGSWTVQAAEELTDPAAVAQACHDVNNDGRYFVEGVGLSVIPTVADLAVMLAAIRRLEAVSTGEAAELCGFLGDAIASDTGTTLYNDDLRLMRRALTDLAQAIEEKGYARFAQTFTQLDETPEDEADTAIASCLVAVNECIARRLDLALASAEQAGA